MLYIDKIRYLLSCISKRRSPQYRACPSCGSNISTIVDSKYLVTSLNRCSICNLLFRSPITTRNENIRFYQDAYKEGLTTDMPSTNELEHMARSNFINTGKDYSTYIQIVNILLNTINNGARKINMLDFGCSWGYGSWQFMNNGFNVVGFEISGPRCSYACDRLGIECYSSLDDLNKYKGHFDLLLLVHVLEHVPSPRHIVRMANELLNKDGLFIAFTPNGSNNYKTKNYIFWHKAWGRVHPQAIDDVFYNTEFHSCPRVYASSPYDLDKLRCVRLDNKNGHYIDDLSGPELLFAAKLR